MPTLNSADADIHYQILGDHGPVIVMIHGLLLGNMATWYFGAASLLSQNHRVIVYDLRGHGMSGKTPSGYDLKTMVEDLKALLDEQDIEKTSLVGHSYGALIGLEFAKAYPSRVERLSMVEGPLPPARGVQIDEFMKRNEDELMGMLPKQLQDALTSRQGKKLLERLMFLVGGTNLLENLQNEEDWDDAELQALG